MGIRLQHGKFSVLLSGDAERTERAWWERKVPSLCSGCTILKLAHHGSDDGTDARWLGLVRSELAVASVGQGNKYGHPGSRTLDLLARSGIPLLRTDRDGTVVVESDGRGWRVVGRRIAARGQPPQGRSKSSLDAGARPVGRPININTATEAELENARLVFQRLQKMSAQGVVPVDQFDQARTARNAARARVAALARQVDAQRSAVELAKANAEQVAVKQSELDATMRQQAAANAQRAKADVRLAYTELHAPIDGIVNVLAARSGEFVEAGQPVVTLINPDDLWVRADVEETYIDRVRIGDPLTVRLPSGVERKGTVYYRAADAAFATQRDVSRTKRDIKTFEIRLRVNNADRRLAVGMTAYVLLPLR